MTKICLWITKTAKFCRKVVVKLSLNCRFFEKFRAIMIASRFAREPFQGERLFCYRVQKGGVDRG